MSKTQLDSIKSENGRDKSCVLKEVLIKKELFFSTISAKTTVLCHCSAKAVIGNT